MKLTTTLAISDHNKSYQVTAEMELNHQTDAGMLSSSTSELLKGMQSGILNCISGKPVQEVASASDWLPAQLPSPSIQKRKQRPSDPVSPKQKKFLNDLLLSNGIDIDSWCREKNTSEDQITASDCQQWIPELQQRIKDKDKSSWKFSWRIFCQDISRTKIMAYFYDKMGYSSISRLQNRFLVIQ